MKPHFLTHCTMDDYASALRTDAQAGLTRSPKSLSTRWCFDGRGRHLFEQATAGHAYLLGTAESQLVNDTASLILARSRPRTLVHIGLSGLMRASPLWNTDGPGPRAVAVCDTPHAPLTDAVTTLSRRLPHLEWYGIAADVPTKVATPPGPGPTLICCLAETYASMRPTERQRFLKAIRRQCLPGDSLLLTTTSAAADILTGLSAKAADLVTEFNRNILYVMNHLLDTDCVDAAFDHVLTTSPGRAEFGLRAKTAIRLPLRMLGFHIDMSKDEHLATFGLGNTSQQTVTDELHDAGFTVDSSHRSSHADVFLHLARVL